MKASAQLLAHAISALLTAASVASLAACSDDGDPGGDAGPMSNPQEPAELTGTLAAHNQVRRQVGLLELSWDPELAATAKAWATRCEDDEAPIGLVDHNPDRGKDVGENIYGSSGAATGPAAVSAWAAESANYNYASNQCTGVCGHYTQLVWRETQRVGCAVHACTSLRFSGTVVCNYSPAGNVNNRRPY
jgi:pathogenesis-related protein 1